MGAQDLCRGGPGETHGERPRNRRVIRAEQQVGAHTSTTAARGSYWARNKDRDVSATAFQGRPAGAHGRSARKRALLTVKTLCTAHPNGLALPAASRLRVVAVDTRTSSQDRAAQQRDDVDKRSTLPTTSIVPG